MVLHVKDVETDALVRQLAQSRGIGITDAIREAVREALEADGSRAARADQARLEDRLRPLFNRLDRLPRPGTPPEKAFCDDLLGGDMK